MTAIDVSAVLTNPARLAALRRLVPLYRPPSITYDRLTRLAAELLEAPVALLTLLDADRQILVSSHGLGDAARSIRQTALDWSICQYTVARGRPLIIGDTADAPYLETNRTVAEFGVRAYAGCPLVTLQGHCVGALCVVDFAPRDWTHDRLAMLADLAAITMDQFRLDGMDRRRAREWSTHSDLSRWLR